MVSASPWPSFVSLCALSMFMVLCNWFWGILSVAWVISTAVVLLCGVLLWLRDVLREASVGSHWLRVSGGFKAGIALFILSEVLFFAGFFWAYFHCASVPVELLGLDWPSVLLLDPWCVPVLNSFILVGSGFLVTWAHMELIESNSALFSLGATVVLGVLFTCLQGAEYGELALMVSSGLMGNIFFVATGFHGLHVFVGTFMLMWCWLRIASHYSATSAADLIGLECAIWYWHFVDVVWLFLFVSVYCWVL